MDERKTPRLERYDYSLGGYYFVTVCTQNRACLFWETGRAGLGPAPTPLLNEFGRLVAETWVDLPSHIAGVELDKFVVMPNHVHGIIRLTGTDPGQIPSAAPAPFVGAGPRPAHPTDAAHSPVSLTEVVRQFKSFSARRVNAVRGTPGIPLWQRSFYDHIIRNEADYLRIWNYIDVNPARWREDEYYIKIAQES